MSIAKHKLALYSSIVTAARLLVRRCRKAQRMVVTLRCFTDAKLALISYIQAEPIFWTSSQIFVIMATEMVGGKFE